MAGAADFPAMSGDAIRAPFHPSRSARYDRARRRSAARSCGLYAAGIAVALGSSRVECLDGSRARLEIAQSLGGNPIQIQDDAPRAGLERATFKEEVT